MGPQLVSCGCEDSIEEFDTDLELQWGRSS